MTDDLLRIREAVERHGESLGTYGAGICVGALVGELGGVLAALPIIAAFMALDVWGRRLRRRRRLTYVEVDELVGCARCGGSHPIAFRPLERPVDDPAGAFTHWAPCPTNGQPVLMRGGQSVQIKLGARE